MGIKIKKELKPQQKLTPLHVKYLFAVPFIGIVNIFTMISCYNKLPAEGMMGAKIFFIFFAAIGAAFAYWGFMWRLTSDNKQIVIRPAFGSKKELKYDDVKFIEVHKKKKNNSIAYCTLHDVNGEIIVKLYPIMNNIAEFLGRLERLGIKRTEIVDR